MSEFILIPQEKWKIVLPSIWRALLNGRSAAAFVTNVVIPENLFAVFNAMCYSTTVVSPVPTLWPGTVIAPTSLAHFLALSTTATTAANEMTENLQQPQLQPQRDTVKEQHRAFGYSDIWGQLDGVFVHHTKTCSDAQTGTFACCNSVDGKKHEDGVPVAIHLPSWHMEWAAFVAGYDSTSTFVTPADLLWQLCPAIQPHPKMTPTMMALLQLHMHSRLPYPAPVADPFYTQHNITDLPFNSIECRLIPADTTQSMRQTTAACAGCWALLGSFSSHAQLSPMSTFALMACADSTVSMNPLRNRVSVRCVRNQLYQMKELRSGNQEAHLDEKLLTQCEWDTRFANFVVGYYSASVHPEDANSACPVCKTLRTAVACVNRFRSSVPQS